MFDLVVATLLNPDGLLLIVPRLPYANYGAVSLRLVNIAPFNPNLLVLINGLRLDDDRLLHNDRLLDYYRRRRWRRRDIRLQRFMEDAADYGAAYDARGNSAIMMVLVFMVMAIVMVAWPAHWPVKHAAAIRTGTRTPAATMP